MYVYVDMFGDLTHSLEGLLALLIRLEIRGHDSEPDHDALVTSSSKTLEDAICHESYVK